MNVPQVVYFILLPGAQARPFIHLEKSCLSSSHAHLKYLLKYYVPDDAMEAWGKILHSYFQIILRLEPLCLGTHHWWVVGHIHSLILAFRAHIPLIPIPVTGHRIGSMASQHVCPAPPSQEVWFFFFLVVPHPLMSDYKHFLYHGQIGSDRSRGQRENSCSF